MKLTLAFCVIALAAGAQTFGVDSPALATLPAQPLADKCASFGAIATLDTYEFNEQSNWSGDNSIFQGWEKVTAEWESSTYTAGWYNNGPQSGMSCSAWWGNYWYNTNWHYCSGTVITGSGENELAAGYCGFLYMGNDRVWVNFGTAVDKILAENDGAGAQHSVDDFKGIKEDGSNMDYTCAVTSVKTYNYPNHKCRVSMQYGEWDENGMGPTVGGLTPGQSEIGDAGSNSQKESDDGTCIGAVNADGNTIARKCAMNDGSGTLTSDWFMSDSAFQVKLETISDHQGEVYYHDTVTVECAVCETTSPTAAPTFAPTAAPTAAPTFAPTAAPTAQPTPEPTAAPTPAPTAAPTAQPTPEPTAQPTPEPTANPTAACRMTCELSSATGLIEVLHDATSGHSHHQCYIDEQNECVCECSGDHDPLKETTLQCTIGDTIATWDEASEWQAGSFIAEHNYQICSAVSWTSTYGFTICSEAHKTYNANGDSSCNLDDTRSCSYTGWHHGSWGSCPSADGCHYYGWGWYRIVGNCIDGVDTMTHVRNYFGNGGDYCAWTSDTKEIPENHAGVNGLNVQLKWKELNQKDANDAIIVYIKACQDAEMQDNCTPWTVAHDHFGDSPNGWDWLDHSDSNSVDVQYKHNYFQTKIIVSTASNAPYMGAEQKVYAVDKLEVKVEKCEA